MRVGRIVAVVAMITSLTFGAGMLITAGGCSGSSGSGGPVAIDEATQKATQEKMREYLAERKDAMKDAMKVQKKK
jgi:hypothetical protein